MENLTLSIDQEIAEATNRLNTKEANYNIEIRKINKRIRSFTGWAWFFVVLGFIISLAGLYVFFKAPDNFKLNLVGDFMGGTTAALWSLAGLFFIYVAFLGQKQQLLNQQLEINYSQIELKSTRLELEGQKLELKAQNETLRQQRFESTFFNLLNLHHQIVNNIDVLKRNRDLEFLQVGQDPKVKVEGRDCFLTFYEGFKTSYNNVIKKEKFDTEQEFINEAYHRFYVKHQWDLGHYFRNLYHIFKLISNSKISNEKQYTSIVRAQLSSHELLMLFYNGLSDNGEKFKPLIEKYHLLKNLAIKELISDSHIQEYSTSAFMKPTDKIDN